MKAISDGRKRKIPNVVCVMSEISRVGGWEFQGTYTGAVSIRGLQQCVKDRTVKNRRVHVVGGENPIRVARGITGGLLKSRLRRRGFHHPRVPPRGPEDWRAREKEWILIVPP